MNNDIGEDEKNNIAIINKTHTETKESINTNKHLKETKNNYLKNENRIKEIKIENAEEEDEKDDKMNNFRNLEIKKRMFRSVKSTEEDKLEKERRKYKIYYKIMKKMKMPYFLSEKNSWDGTIDEIISRQLIKIHNNDNEINKKKIDKAYNIVQNGKSQKIKNRLTHYNIYRNPSNNKEYDSDDGVIMNKLVKSKSTGKFFVHSNNNSKEKNIEKLRYFNIDNFC